MDPARKHASHQHLGSCINSPNGSDPVDAEQKTNSVETGPVSTTEFPATCGPASGAAPSPPPAAAAQLWLMRIWVVIRVAFFDELGMVLVVLPWTRAWTENSLLLAYPSVRLFLQNNFVRGVISGLGFLDVGFGVWEAIRYKESPRSQKPS